MLNKLPQNPPAWLQQAHFRANTVKSARTTQDDKEFIKSTDNIVRMTTAHHTDAVTKLEYGGGGTDC